MNIGSPNEIGKFTKYIVYGFAGLISILGLFLPIWGDRKFWMFVLPIMIFLGVMGNNSQKNSKWVFIFSHFGFWGSLFAFVRFGKEEFIALCLICLLFMIFYGLKECHMAISKINTEKNEIKQKNQN